MTKIETATAFIKRKNEQFEQELSDPVSFIKMKDIKRKGYYCFKRKSWAFIPQHNLKEKVFLIEKIKFDHVEGKRTHQSVRIGDIEFRFCYFIVGKIGRAKNKWVWEQFCPIIPKKDFANLLNIAKRKKLF